MPHRQLEPLLDRPPDLQLAPDGSIGDRLRANELNWLLLAPATNPGMIDVFRHRLDLHSLNGPGDPLDPIPWAGEFAGKYLLSAVQSLQLTRSSRLERVVNDFVQQLILSQGDDGSLGLPLAWDLWGQYHVLLGLLRWYELAGGSNVLAACRRAADLACRRYLGRASAIATDHPADEEKNQAVAHVLALLYESTAETTYLELAREIEAEWSTPTGGNFIANALAGREFFSGLRPRWESLHDVQAIAELYFITGESRYRTAFEQIWRSIRTHDRHVTGGFSSGESATGDPFDPRYIETCGTVAWMALTIDMLRVTADSSAADELELSLFNAILGAQSPDGRLWTYHTPMGGIPIDGIENGYAARLGYRFPALYDLAWQERDRYPQLSCCAANGPRGIGCLSEWAVMRSSDAVVVNYYGPSAVTLEAPGGVQLTLTQATNYPIDGAVRITVHPSQATLFTIRLRVPAWSTNSNVAVNGVPHPCTAGTYCDLRREWRGGDHITLELDMSTRVVMGDGRARGLSVAYRGPLLLTYDTRHGGLDPLAMPAIGLRSPPVIAPGTHGTELLATFPSTVGQVTLCDFASAGQSPAGRLSRRPDTSGPWQFSRSDGTLIAEQIHLLGTGAIAGYSHPNEARWGYEGDTLTFFAQSGAASTRFTLRTEQHGKQVLSGRSLVDDRVRHVLAQVDLDIVGKTWQFSRRSGDPTVNTILRSTIRLLPGGGFDVPTHPNETRWAMEGSTLVFFAANGAPSTRFTAIRMQNGRVERRGEFLFDRSISHVLSEVDLDVTSKVWRFVRLGGTAPEVIADKLRLLPNHRLDGYWHPNEASWTQDATDKLTFVSARGAVTTPFNDFSAAGGVMRFSGTFQPNTSIVHVLEEAGPGWTVDSTYVAWLPAIRG